MTDTPLDPAIVVRFRELRPPYLGAAHIRLAQDIRDEAVAEVAAEREYYSGLAEGRERLLRDLTEAARLVAVAFDDDQLQDASDDLRGYVDELVAELRAFYVGRGEDPDPLLNHLERE